MWTRTLLKDNAKQALKGRYWRSFWICLALSIAGLAGQVPAAAVQRGRQWIPRRGYILGLRHPQRHPGQYAHGVGRRRTYRCGHQYLLGAVRAVPAQRRSLPLFYGEPPVPDPGLHCRQHLPPPLRQPYCCAAARQFKVTLGYILLIVPGVYWSYCYALVPYLLAENPYMTATRAMELSKEMMEGEKWNYFVLQLSFFGWLLLCAFTLGIGGFFLEPYMQATYAEFYAAMRSKALATGMSTTDELGGFVRHDTFK